MSKRYHKLVERVFLQIGVDKDLIKAVATLCDVLESWENPDLRNYKEEVGTAPLPFLHNGELRVNKFQAAYFDEAFAAEIFSHEIRSHSSLEGLTEMFKRLRRSSSEIPSNVFRNILMKMFWLCSQK